MKRKKVNRGGILFIVIAVILAIAIVSETLYNAGLKRLAEKTVGEIVEIVADAMMLPEDMAGKVLSEEEAKKYTDQFREKISDYYADGLISGKDAFIDLTCECLNDFLLNKGVSPSYDIYESNHDADYGKTMNSSFDEYTDVFTVNFGENGSIYGRTYNFRVSLCRLDGEWKAVSVTFQ